MDCPRCSVEMTEIAGDDGAMKRCSDCGGLWADSTDVNRFLLHANLPAIQAIGGYVNPEEMAGQCPTCQVDLVSVEGGQKRMLHYDTCESCGAIWLEGPEEGEVPESIDWKAAEKEIVAFYRRFTKRR
jgi:Zn-finger nucleic acid-binding protein